MKKRLHGSGILLKSIAKMTRLDTNYILRYLLNDNEKMATVAESVIMHQKVFIANEVMAEVVYVLEGVYTLSRGEIAKVLTALLKETNIDAIDKYMLLKGLEIYSQKKLDFVDCLLCAYSEADEVLTFDKKLQKCIKI